MVPEQIDAVFDIFEAFPTMEAELLDIFTACALKEISCIEYERKTRVLCVDYIKNCIVCIKQGMKSDKSLSLAYFDVARYQTDPLDAAIEWGADVDLLRLMLKRRPPPTTPRERQCLPVPIEITKRREFL